MAFGLGIDGGIPIEADAPCALLVTSSIVRARASASSAVNRFLEFGCKRPWSSSVILSVRPGAGMSCTFDDVNNSQCCKRTWRLGYRHKVWKPNKS